MRKSRFTTEQIIRFIKQAEAGMAVSELGRQHGFSPSCPSPPRKAMRPRCTHEDQIVDVTPSALGYE